MMDQSETNHERDDDECVELEYSKLEPLSFKQWWDDVGTENVKKVADLTFVALTHLRQFRYGLRSMSPNQAKRVIAAAKKVTPGFVPDFDLLTAPLVKREKRTLLIHPSLRYIAYLAAREAKKRERKLAREAKKLAESGGE